MRKQIFWLLIPAIGGAVALLAATPFGVGLFPDSVMYILSARSILHGYGLTVNGAPITWFPPLYPALLAAPGSLGFDPAEAARWIQCAFFACNIFWIGALAIRYSGSLLLAFLTAVISLGAVDMITYHASAMSEGAFLLFSLPALLLIDSFLERRKRRVLVLSGFMMAAASLTRTIGLAWLAGWTLIIVFHHGADIRQRLKEGGIFLLIGIVPTLAWFFRSLSYHAPMGRSLNMHSFLSSAEWQSLSHTFTGWFLQWRVDDSAWAALPLILIVPLIVLWIRSRGREETRHGSGQPAVLVVSAVSYLLFLICAAAFFQADLFRDSPRMLLPIHVLFLVIAISAASRWLASYKSRLPAIAGAAVLLAACALVLSSGIRQIRAMSSDGQGYAGRAFRESPLLQKVRTLPPQTALYANLVLPIAYYTGRFSNYIPSKIVNSTQRPNEEYDSQMVRMAEDLRSRNAVIVYFKRGNNWFVQPSLPEIERVVPLRVIDEERDGWMCGADSLR